MAQRVVVDPIHQCYSSERSFSAPLPAPCHREIRANEMVGSALSSFLVLFSLPLGLVAVATYQNYPSVGDIVDKEASSVAALYRDFGAYPQPMRDRLRKYVRYTIEEGCPKQARATDHNVFRGVTRL